MTDLYIIVAWLASIYVFAKVLAVLPDPEACTELGEAVRNVAQVAISVGCMASSAIMAWNFVV